MQRHRRCILECVFPVQIAYIHFPYLNRYTFSRAFPYLNNPRFSQAGTLPHVILEKKLVDYNNKLVLANSHYTAREIQEYSRKSAEVLYPPFPSSILAIGKKAIKNSRQKLVVTVSRLDANKYLERIPQIAAQTDKTINFAVVGRLYNQTTFNRLQALVKKLDVSDRVSPVQCSPNKN